MANVTLTLDLRRYPDGSALAAYPQSNWPTPYDPAGEPVGNAAAIATSAAGKVTFTGLATGTSYWLTFERDVSQEQYPYTTFAVPAPEGGFALPELPPNDGKAYALIVTDGELSWLDTTGW